MRSSYILVTALQCVLIILSFSLASQAQAFEFTDQSGVIHRFDKPYGRIISLYPAHTENLADIGASDVLLGISTSDTYPKSILLKERFSYRDTAERFIAARPDCILIRPMIRNSAPNLVKKLEEFGITVISLQPTTVSELYDYWRILGLVSGRQSEAEEMTRRFKDELGKLSRIVSAIPEPRRPHVYFEAIHESMKTFSPDSITMFTLESAGGINIAVHAVPRRSTNIAAYSKEKILSDADRIDAYLAQYGRMNRVTVEDIISEAGFGAIKAVRDGRVYLVDETLVSRPTTRLIEGMWRIHKLLFQDLPK